MICQLAADHKQESESDSLCLSGKHCARIFQSAGPYWLAGYSLTHYCLCNVEQESQIIRNTPFLTFSTHHWLSKWWLKTEKAGSHQQVLMYYAVLWPVSQPEIHVCLPREEIRSTSAIMNIVLPQSATKLNFHPVTTSSLTGHYYLGLIRVYFNFAGVFCQNTGREL